jgi:hypothetical protein
MIGWNRIVQNEIVRRRHYTIDRISCSPLHFLQVAVVQKQFRAIFRSAGPAWPLSSEAYTLNGVPYPEHWLFGLSHGRHKEMLATDLGGASSSRVDQKRCR